MVAISDSLLISIDQKAAPEVAALLVIDVQNDFVANGGFFDRIGTDVARIQRAIPPVTRLVEAARETRVLVVFIQAIYDETVLSAPMRERNARCKLEAPRCITGSWGADFYGVRPLPGEPVLIKHRYSAFTNPDLDRLLQLHGIKSLLLTGVSTDTCVESTGRDLYFADYYVTMIGDCCGAASESDHLSALKRFDRDYGAVASSDEVIAAWRRSSAKKPLIGNVGYG